jgi:hypothetical protein
MTDHNKLAEAMRALGYTDVEAGTLSVVGKSKKHGWISFSRERENQPFYTADAIADSLPELQTKYAEVGVRAWAKKRNFAVESFKDNKMTLVNRRG